MTDNIPAPLRAGAAVSFVGLGRMGRPMASLLGSAGYQVTGYDASQEARETLLAEDPRLEVAPSAASAATGAAAVVLMLPDSAAVSRVLEHDGLLGQLPPGVIVIDMGSSEPAETQRLARAAAEREVRYVDAPVSGGVSGAERGSLTIMAGGPAAVIEAVRPLLGVLGSRVLHVGPPGAGHAVKALNNLMSAAHLLVTSEAMVAAGTFGLDVATVLDAVNTSSGRSGSTENKWPNFILPGTYNSGFALSLMLKDMKIADGLIRATGGTGPLSGAAVQFWDAAAARLGPAADHTEIVRWLRDGAPKAP